MKKCVLEDKICQNCGECDQCDLDRNKKCNNCMECVTPTGDYVKIIIDQIKVD